MKDCGHRRSDALIQITPLSYTRGLKAEARSPKPYFTMTVSMFAPATT